MSVHILCVHTLYIVCVYAAAVQQLLPPENVQIVEQSIDPDTQSLKVLVKWDPIEAESSSDIIGYAVYVDGELYCSVAGAETCQVELSNLVPKVSLLLNCKLDFNFCFMLENIYRHCALLCQ